MTLPLRPLAATAALVLLASAPTTPAPAPASPGTLRPFLVALSVASVERSAAWYEAHLGFEIVRAPNNPRPGIGNAILRRNDFYLELVSVAGSTIRASALPLPGQNGSLQGLYKLAFWVPDIDSAAAALQQAGVPIPRGIWADTAFAGGTSFLLFEDPDGIVLQLFGPLPPRP